MHLYIHLHMYMYRYKCIYIYTYIYIHIYVYIYIYTHTHPCVCVYEQMPDLEGIERFVGLDAIDKPEIRAEEQRVHTHVYMYM